MTYQYEQRIDNLMFDFLSHAYFSPEHALIVEQDLRSIIQKEFFYRLVSALPEKETISIQECIQINGLDDKKTYHDLSRICLSIYTCDYMRTQLDQSITHILTTYINITMKALSKEQQQELGDFQRNLLLSQST